MSEQEIEVENLGGGIMLFRNAVSVNHDFLIHLEKKYRISKLVEEVKCRPDRCCLERIFGCLFFIENNNILKKKSLFGNIHLYHKWGYNYDQYERAFYSGKVPRPIIKVWTGR